VALAQDSLVQDPNAANHQQPQVADEMIRDLFVLDVVAVNVEAEPLTLDTTAVGELDLEVELDAVLGWLAHGLKLCGLQARGSGTAATPPSSGSLRGRSQT
jgi:hypothetical protein